MSIAAVGQFCATSAIHLNKSICKDLVHQASKLGAKMLFLPEASDFISRNKQETLALTTSLESSDFLQGLSQSAKESQMWISVGLHESANPEQVYNTQVVIDEKGEIVSVYRKLHLFNVDIENGPRLMESDSTLAGQKISSPVKTPIGQLGLETCYDMRFPELSLALRKRGAELLSFPSAFTIKTGMAHWETLLRARAIETQTFVFAAAQIGQHNEKRASFGNSMIIDPWGTVLARCGDNNTKPTIATATIDLDYLNKIRVEMPVMEHRRTDLYE